MMTKLLILLFALGLTSTVEAQSNKGIAVYFKGSPAASLPPAAPSGPVGPRVYIYRNGGPGDRSQFQQAPVVPSVSSATSIQQPIYPSVSLPALTGPVVQYVRPPVVGNTAPFRLCVKRGDVETCNMHKPAP